jgi:hypothetical protein
MTVDVLLLSVPRIAPVRPQAALGILKTLCNQAGKTSATFDINHDFFMRLANQSPASAKIIDDYFVTFTDPLPVDTQSIYNNWLMYWVDRIVELDSDWYRRNHNLVFCYNETRREHFFIDPVGLAIMLQTMKNSVLKG